MKPKRHPSGGWSCLLLAWALLGGLEVQGADHAAPVPEHTAPHLAGSDVPWSLREQAWRTLTFADHNTRVVTAGVTVLGAAGGLVGTFLLLRRRSLLSDTVSHSTLPGVGLAFLVAEGLGRSGKSLPWLLAGATVTGVLGMVAVAVIRSRTRVKDDAALAIVLGVFFGLGIALVVMVQQLPTGNAAGLSRFLYGKVAAMTAADARLMLMAGLIMALLCLACFKELKLLCFDPDFARAQGWPVVMLDLLLMALVVGVTIIGLQAVGLLLVVALLIIPAASARFWTHRLGATAVVATGLGAASGLTGALASAMLPRLPAGAVIVLAAVGGFAVSFFFGLRRGLLVRWIERYLVTARVTRQHLLRAVYEWCEAGATPGNSDPATLLDRPFDIEALCAANHWSPARWRRLRRVGRRQGLLTCDPRDGTCRLTASGKLEARRVTRNHRLWETYLLHFADVAPHHLHHNADQIEHVVDPAVVNHLEELLAARGGGALVPSNPEPAVAPAPKHGRP